MKKVLIIRLSSLGDVILASSVLGLREPGESVDWLTSQEYASLFQKHPAIHQVLVFDRKTKLRGWIRQCRQIFNSDYDQIVDLHSSLRTRILKFLLMYWSLQEQRTVKKTKLIDLKKHKWKYFGYFVFKRFWPRGLRPLPYWTEVCRVWKSGEGLLTPPNMSHLLSESRFSVSSPRPYYCVMPSARWISKEWSVQKFVEVISRLPFLPVILGTAGDRKSLELVSELKKRQMDYISCVGTLTLPDVANYLSGAKFYLGSDTGLAHLAESVGTPAYVLFGPTVPDLGYGPWHPGSMSLKSGIWCQPCGKDGRFCHRVFRRYECFEKLRSNDVEQAIVVKLQGAVSDA